MPSSTNNETFVLDGYPIFNGESFIYNKAIHVKSGLIHKITKSSIDLSTSSVCSSPCLQANAKSTIDNTGFLAPAFIDCQVNGGGGILFNNEFSILALEHVAKAHARKATTRFLATLITDKSSVYNNVTTVLNSDILPESVLGLHIEGPFISKDFKGTHKDKYIRNYKDNDINWLKSLAKKKLLLTLDISILSNKQIKNILDNDILISFGHSCVPYDKIVKVVSSFSNYNFSFTHLFNAMPKYESRNPGIVGAGLDIDNAFISIIVDGIHLHDASVRLAYKTKPQGKIILVSDAMSTISAKSKKFQLYEQIIEVKKGKLVNKEGTLSGSTVGLSDCVEYSYKKLNFPLSECLKMASLYPAKFLSLDNRFGRLEEGYVADIVHFDNNLNVLKVWRDGVMVYNSNKDSTLLAWHDK